VILDGLHMEMFACFSSLVYIGICEKFRKLGVFIMICDAWCRFISVLCLNAKLYGKSFGKYML